MTAQSQTATYRSWTAMLKRCRNPNYEKYSYYGGRGITVCDRWLEFENFLDDMGERPVGKTLDRHPDTDGNYEPGNCRWATKTEQAMNRRSSKLTLDLVQEMLGRFEHGESRDSIAGRLSISKSWAVAIIGGRYIPELDRPWLHSTGHGLVVGKGNNPASHGHKYRSSP